MSFPIVVEYVDAQSAGSQTSVTTAGITTTTGNLLVAVMSAFGNFIGATPITDSNGNTWTQAVASTGTTEGWGSIFFCANATGGAAHTFTFTVTSATFIALAVFEITGAAASPLSNVNSASSTGSTDHDSGNVTTSSTLDEILIGGGTSSDAGTGTVRDSTFTWNNRSLAASGSLQGINFAWRNASPSTTISYISVTIATDRDTSMIAGFKGTAPATAGATSYGYS